MSEPQSPRPDAGTPSGAQHPETGLRAIFDHTSQFMVVLSTDGVVLDANRGASATPSGSRNPAAPSR